MTELKPQYTYGKPWQYKPFCDCRECNCIEDVDGDGEVCQRCQNGQHDYDSDDMFSNAAKLAAEARRADAEDNSAARQHPEGL